MYSTEIFSVFLKKGNCKFEIREEIKNKKRGEDEQYDIKQ